MWHIVRMKNNIIDHANSRESLLAAIFDIKPEHAPSTVYRKLLQVRRVSKSTAVQQREFYSSLIRRARAACKA